ncbi:hypothetical protein EON66_00965 [archaeon]|nr:MAG: hypothetical protein EON66_00965 [archaeon]
MRAGDRADAEAAYLAGQVGVTSPGHLSPAEAAKWAELRKEIKAAAVDEVVRYCVLKSASGVGLIDEAELKKVPALCTLPGVNVRAALVAADAELQSVFGMRLVVTWKRYVIDSARTCCSFPHCN